MMCTVPIASDCLGRPVPSCCRLEVYPLLQWTVSVERLLLHLQELSSPALLAWSGGGVGGGSFVGEWGASCLGCRVFESVGDGRVVEWSEVGLLWLVVDTGVRWGSMQGVYVLRICKCC